MATFVVGAPIETASPLILVDTPPTNPIMPGVHRFQLQVRDNDGLVSKPAFFDVVVRDDRAPTAVIDAPTEVLFGRAFELHGERSSDPFPGKIVAYVWTMLS